MMIVAFRVDASQQIGTGHVMRCLTLADALRASGSQCHFICREQPGHLMAGITERGHRVHRLPPPAKPLQAGLSLHAQWLGVTPQQDADDCRPELQTLSPDWLIVDHYALDAFWEQQVTPPQTRLMVIDDLADRPHQCHLLLDQNLGRTAADYHGLVPQHCQVLAGPHYALLRPEFPSLRSRSGNETGTGTRDGSLRQLLITMGGMDADNASGQVLTVLENTPLPPDTRITLVMGAQAPWLEAVRAQAQRLSWPTEVKVNVRDMATLMAEADLAIGAAGSTSWERCCLGLPTLMLVLAENQRFIADHLDTYGAAINLGRLDGSGERLQNSPWQAKLSQELQALQADPNRLARMAHTAAAQVDGQGTRRIIDHLSGARTP